MLRWKTLLALLIVNLFSGQAKSAGANLRLGEFIQVLGASTQVVQKRQWLQTEIQNFRVQGDEMSFRIKGVYFHLQVLAAKPHVLRLNGQLFTAQDLQTSQMAYRRLLQKFSLMPSQVSWLDLIIGKAQAQSVVDPLGGLEASEAVSPRPAAASTETTAPASDTNLEGRFHSYQFASNQPVQNRITSVAGLKNFLKDNDIREVLGVAAAMMAAINGFSAENPIFDQMLELGVPSGQTPAAPAFSSSWKSRS